MQRPCRDLTLNSLADSELFPWPTVISGLLDIDRKRDFRLLVPQSAGKK
jgi:hypothetical protein